MSASGQPDTHRIHRDELMRFTAAVLEAAGVPREDAGTVADCLVYANLSGMDSHGVVRLAHYVRRLQNGSIKTRPEIEIEQSAPSVLRVDGDNGLGHVITHAACMRGIEICRGQGSAHVSIRNSSHFGMAGYYLRDITAAGLGGMVMTHSDALIVPFGARKPFVGTNPIALGFPTGDVPFVLDMSTSSIAYGHIALAKVEGREIPSDWAVDEDGEPTTDPSRAVGMHPFAGHKGSGLALAIEAFTALLSGVPFGPHVNRMYHDMDSPRRLGHFIAMWDIEAFRPPADFQASINEMITELHQLPARDENHPVYYPGELEGLRRAERSRDGIPIQSGLYQELTELGRGFGHTLTEM